MTLLKVIGWLSVPYVMIVLQWKKLNTVVKIVGSIYAVISLLIFIGALFSPEQPSTEQVQTESVPKETTTVAEDTKPFTLYPDTLLKEIEKLKEPGMSKVDKYTMFEQNLVGLNPTEKEMLEHKKIVIDAYKQLSFDTIQTIDDETILKQIYSARIVDKYFSFDDASNSTGLFAFNYLQIAKDAYRGILEKENYNINKKTMDNHYGNMQ